MKEDSISTFIGYREITLPVSKRKVQVRQLPVRDFPRLSEVIESEPGIVELCTGLKTEDIDSLAIEDFEALYSAAEEENLRPFSRWIKRRKAMARHLDRVFGETNQGTSPKESGMDGANT